MTADVAEPEWEAKQRQDPVTVCAGMECLRTVTRKESGYAAEIFEKEKRNF